MSQNFVGSISNKDVYLIDDKYTPYFIGIPKGDKVQIVINLVDDMKGIDISLSSPMVVKNNILDLYNTFGINDSAVVTPVINNGVMDNIKNDNQDYFAWLNQAMGHLINVVYRNLKDTFGKEVFEQIGLNDNVSYKVFNDKFLSMYSDRVCLVSFNNANLSNSLSNNSNNDVQSVNMANDNLANTTTISLDDAYKEFENDDNSVVNVKPKSLTKKKEAGFVSYVLLGVVVAVISLVILYMLL